jgi:hypothetical protein
MPAPPTRTRRACCTYCADRPVLREIQPDEADHVRLLLVCPNPQCRRWFLRVEIPDGRSTVAPLKEVPTLEELKVALDRVPTRAEADAARGLHLRLVRRQAASA